MTSRTWLAWFWTLVILGLCWLPRMYIPGEERLPPPFVLNFDKYVHTGIFAVFAFLWMRTRETKLRALWILLWGVALAAISEIGQENRFVDRDANVADALADIVGVVVGIFAYSLVRNLKAKRTLRNQV
jgi:VanZ family protein